MLAKRQEAMRKFEGPFLILGISPHWPEELERRKVDGVHSTLADIRPVAALRAFEDTKAKIVDEAVSKGLLKRPYAAPRVKTEQAPAKVQVAPTHRKDLSKPLSDRFVGWLERAAGLLSEKPRTARQVAKAIGASEPTVYAILDVLSRKGFPLRKDKREGKRAALWSLACVPAQPRAHKVKA